MTVPYFNQPLYDALSKQIGLGYNEQKGREVVDAVHKALINGLGVDNEEILPNAGLASGLLAESIDGLDIRFRIEKPLRLKDETKSLGQLVKKTQTGPKETDYTETEKTVLELTREAYELHVRI